MLAGSVTAQTRVSTSQITAPNARPGQLCNAVSPEGVFVCAEIDAATMRLEFRTGLPPLLKALPLAQRQYDFLLARDPATGGYALPAAAKNIELWVNGVKYRQPGNWSLISGQIVPDPAAKNWPQDAEVTINYDPAL